MIKNVLSATICLFALVACSPPAAHTDGKTPAGTEPAAHAAGSAPHWSYADQTHWGESCPTGKAQSPIALLNAGAPTDLPDLVTTYPAGNGKILDNGHTLQFKPDAPGSITLGADAYNLAQFHFHAPGEHTLDGVSYPVEVHFVNKNAQEQLAVVGVFLKPGAENPALAALLAALPTGEGDANTTQASIDLSALLPKDRFYFAYSGSLTTPPCSEGVRWNVLRTPVEASSAQITALTTALGASNRALQPLNERALAFGQ